MAEVHGQAKVAHTAKRPLFTAKSDRFAFQRTRENPQLAQFAVDKRQSVLADKRAEVAPRNLDANGHFEHAHLVLGRGTRRLAEGWPWPGQPCSVMV